MNKQNLGNKAYYDTFTGLIPCKVTGVRVWDKEYGRYEVEFIITTTRGAYKKGEKLFANPRNVVPRLCVFVRSGQYHIKTGYTWEEVNGQVTASLFIYK